MRRVTAQPRAAFLFSRQNLRPKGDFLGHTMKFLIVSDIHGNREALEAVLKMLGVNMIKTSAWATLSATARIPNFVFIGARQCFAIVRGNHDAVCAGLESLEPLQ